MIRIVPVTDEHFAWMLGDAAPQDGLTLPEGGVAEGFVISHVRQIAAKQREDGYDGSWMMLDDDEVVGLCGHHAPPANGTVEIGYNVAPARERRGYATRAIALIVEDAMASDEIQTIVAHTAFDNIASQRVLEHNDFERAGEGVSDGEPVIRWIRNVRRKTA